MVSAVSEVFIPHIRLRIEQLDRLGPEAFCAEVSEVTRALGAPARELAAVELVHAWQLADANSRERAVAEEALASILRSCPDRAERIWCAEQAVRAVADRTSGTASVDALLSRLALPISEVVQVQARLCTSGSGALVAQSADALCLSLARACSAHGPGLDDEAAGSVSSCPVLRERVLPQLPADIAERIRKRCDEELAAAAPGVPGSLGTGRAPPAGVVEAARREDSHPSGLLFGGAFAMTEIIEEIGYRCSCSEDVFSAVWALTGPTNERSVASLVAMMVRTSAGLSDRVAPGNAAVLSSVVDQLPSSAVAKLESCGPMTTWNVDVVARVLRSTAPALRWDDICMRLDMPGFVVPDASALALLARLYGVATQGAALPVSLAMTTWQNASGHVSLLEQAVVAAPEIFRFDRAPRVQAGVPNLPSRVPTSDGPPNKSWNAVDLYAVLFELSTGPAAARARALIDIPFQQCPELMLVCIIQLDSPAADTPMYAEVLAAALGSFLNGHANCTAVLQHAWRVCARGLLRGLREVFRAEPTSLARLLDAVLEARLLKEVLDEAPSDFALELAALASRREYLNMEKWSTERFSKHGVVFLHDALSFLSTKLLNRDLHTQGASSSALVKGNSATATPLSQEIAELLLHSLFAQLPSLPAAAADELKRLYTDVTQVHPTLRVAAAEREGLYAPDVESAANAHFQKIYTAQQGIGEVMAMLKQFHESGNARERQIFSCMIHNLFDEYRFFPKYPDRELHITAVLFGSLVREKLVSNVTLGIALRYVLEGLKRGVGSKMYKFGLTALKEFQSRLSEWPQYCAHVVQIPHLAADQAQLVESLNHITERDPGQRAQGGAVQARALAGAPGAGSSAGSVTNASGAAGSSPPTAAAVPAGSVTPDSKGERRRARGENSLTALNIDTLVDAGALSGITQPPESVRDRMHFVLNNLSSTNLAQKSDELRRIMKPEYVAYLAQYFVVKRASMEANFHELYLAFLSQYGDAGLNAAVTRATLRNICVLLGSDKVRSSSSERSLLKNLGAWLGLTTLAQNRPILLDELDLKRLLLEAYESGRLIAILPFVCKVLTASAASRVFRVPNPYVVGLIRVLMELHGLPDLKLNLRFEIEMLLKSLRVHAKRIAPSDILRTLRRPPRVANPDFSDQHSPALGAADTARGGATGSSYPSPSPVSSPPASARSSPPGPFGEPGVSVASLSMPGGAAMYGLPQGVAYSPQHGGSGSGPAGSSGASRGLGSLLGAHEMHAGFGLGGSGSGAQGSSTLFAGHGVGGGDGGASGPGPVSAVMRPRPHMLSSLAGDAGGGPMGGGEVLRRAVSQGSPPLSGFAGMDGPDNSSMPMLMRQDSAPAGGSAGSAAAAAAAAAAADAAGLMRRVRVPQSLDVLNQYPNLRRAIPHVIDRAVRDIVAPIVERTASVACITTRELVAKDFLCEPNDRKLTECANAMAQRLSSALAAVMSREAVRTNLTSHLRAMMQNAGVDAASAEHAAYVLATENLDIGLLAIEKATAEKAQRDVEQQIAGLVAPRRKAAASGHVYMDPALPSMRSVLDALPPSLRVQPGVGISERQARIYEDFALVPRTAEEAARRSDASAVRSPHLGGSSGDAATAAAEAAVAPGAGDSANDDGGGPSVSTPPVSQQQQLLEQYIRSRTAAAASNSGVIVIPAMRSIEQCGILLVHVSEYAAAEKDAALSSLTSPHPLLETFARLCRTVAHSVPHSDVAAFVVQRQMKALIERAHSGRLAFESCIGLLELMHAMWPGTRKEVTAALTFAEPSVLLDGPLVCRLVAAGVVNVPELDAAIGRTMESTPPDKFAAFAMHILRRCIAEHYASVADLPVTLRGVDLLLQSGPNSSAVGALRDAAAALAAQQQQSRLNGPPRMMTVFPPGVHALSLVTGDLPPTGSGGAAGGRMRTGGAPPAATTVSFNADALSRAESMLREWRELLETSNVTEVGLSSYVVDVCRRGTFQSEEAAEQNAAALVSCAMAQWRGKLLPLFARLVVVLVRYAPERGESISRVGVLSKFLPAIVRQLLEEHDSPSFSQNTYLLLLESILEGLSHSVQSLDSIAVQVLTSFATTLHNANPLRAPGFAFAWLHLVSHRAFMSRLLLPKSQRGWPAFLRLLIDLLRFLDTSLDGVGDDVPDSLSTFYKGSLRVLLVLLHDFPEVLCDYHLSLCDAIPQQCIQMRNLVLSAFPRNMRLPDPFTPNLKVDLLPEIAHPPRVLSNFASALNASGLKAPLDAYLKTRQSVSFLMELPQRLLLAPGSAARGAYNAPLVNALVLYVGTQGIAQLQSEPRSGGSAGGSLSVEQSAPMDVFQQLVLDLDAEGRYLVLNAIANQLRYPNSHTHYFSCVILSLFGAVDRDIVREQITRVLLERLIVNRPHPWGLLVTFIELIKNPRFRFWEHGFTRCAPEVERLFESVAQTCLYPGQANASRESAAGPPVRSGQR